MLLALILTTALADGRALLQAGRRLEAHAAFKQAVREAPSDPEALTALGQTTLQVRRDLDRAVELLEQAVALAPRSSRAHLLLAAALGLKAQAGSLFEKLRLAGRIRGEMDEAVRLEPASVEAHGALFTFFLVAPGIAGGSLDEARAQAAELLRLDAHQGALALAQLAVHEGQDPRTALADARAAARDDWQRGDTWSREGSWHLAQRRPSDAEAAFRAALRCQPLLASAHDGLADALDAQGRSVEALAERRRATEVDPSSAKWWSKLGHALELRGDLAGASAAYEKFLELVPRGEQADEARERLSALR